MNTDAPVFVVVGNVNQGKSSIVASLSEDPSVPIAPQPGTTVRSGEYAFSSADRVLFRLIDTPGFQEARAALAWMQERSFSAMDHGDAVRAFVREFESQDRFKDEVRLLQPILGGASILYVVDASGPPQPSNEAEMEILRWTGQPRMALVNRTRERDHADDWRPYLEQFFNVVRSYNAHEAGFEDRMNLLRSFREVRDSWRGAMDEAIGVMEREWRNRRQRAAGIMAEFLVRALGHVERLEVRGETASEEDRARVSDAYLKALRDMEEDGRTEIESVFRHHRIARKDEELSLHEADLFSDTSWRAFGLTRNQLARYGVAWGTAIGAAIDLMVGGLSFFLGAAVGAVTGGLAGFLGGTRVARTWGNRSRLARILFPGEHGRFIAMGPATNPRFAWMLVDRALVHYRAVRSRSHARRDVLNVETAAKEDAKSGIAAALPPETRGALDGVLQRILKQALHGSVAPDTERRMRELLTHVMDTEAT